MSKVSCGILPGDVSRHIDRQEPACTLIFTCMALSAERVVESISCMVQTFLLKQNKQMISYLLCIKKNGCFLETKLDVIVKSSKSNNLVVHFFLCNFGGESSGRRLNRSKSLPARDETLLINGRITRGVQWIRPLQNIIDPILHRELMVGKNKKPSSELLC